MTVDADITRPDPHCIAWMQATASLWGMSSEHELDEPVQISDEVPARVRVAATTPGQFDILFDRDLSLKATRPGTHTHVAIRFNVRGRMFAELELTPHTLRMGDGAHLKRFT